MPQCLNLAPFPSPPLKFRAVSFPQHGFKYRHNSISVISFPSGLIWPSFIYFCFPLFTPSVNSLSAIRQVSTFSINRLYPEVLCSVKLCCLYLYRYYHLIRHSDRYFLISFLSYTESITPIRPSPLWLLILIRLSSFLRREDYQVHLPNSSLIISTIAKIWVAWLF